MYGFNEEIKFEVTFEIYSNGFSKLKKFCEFY